jgi:hypothetical protein
MSHFVLLSPTNLTSYARFTVDRACPTRVHLAFMEPRRNTEPVTLTIRFPAALIQRLRENAARDERSVGFVVRRLVVKGLEEEAKKSA